MYLSDAVLTPTIWQTAQPLLASALHIAAGYLPVYLMICLLFPKETQ
jgi:hypothetical protein